jgi:hypothetical protein
MKLNHSRGFLAALLGLAGPAVRHGGGSAARQTPANSSANGYKRAQAGCGGSAHGR